MTYNSNAPWLDRSLKLKPIFEPLLSSIATDIASKIGKRRRKDGVENIKTALSVVAANLLRLHALCPSHGLRIDLSNDGYREGQFNPNRLGCRAVRKVVDYLENSNPPLIDRKGGNYDRTRKHGYTTEIWITDSFKKKILNYLIRFIVNRSNIKELYNQPITRNTFGIDEYLIYGSVLFEEDTLPIIRLRDTSSKKGGKLLDFEKTPETDLMEERLGAYNSFLASHGPLNLFATAREIKELLSKPNESLDDFGNIDFDNRLIDLVSGNKLYRVFNDGRFDHGGRFYGGWWLHVESTYRPLITINGQPTVEVDFSGMQLAMLYAKVGQQLDGDPYAIEEIGEEFRPLIKEATLKLINARGRIERPRKSVLPQGVSWEGLQQAIIARHGPIAEFFRSGEGIRLQRLDADIAEDVILKMMEKGILALPVHDSFIVTEGHAGLLVAAMKDSYQRAMGYRIDTKRSHSLFDELLAGKVGLNADERHTLGLELFEAKKASPEYEGYRQREKLLGGAESPQENSQIGHAHRADNRLNDKATKTGPREETANPGENVALGALKRLWDRSTGERRAS